MSVAPDSCWPYDLRTGFQTKPNGVFLAEVQPIDNRGRPVGDAIMANQIQWDFVIKSGTPAIRILNIPGLEAGRYRIRLLVVKE